MRDMITILKEWDIPYCVWNYLSTPNDENRFSLVNDDNRKTLSEELHRIIPSGVVAYQTLIYAAVYAILLIFAQWFYPCSHQRPHTWLWNIY